MVNIKNFWRGVLRQDADAIRAYFHPGAWVNWHNTDEHFTVEEFIRANCEYPGHWDGEVERMVEAEGVIVTATRVYAKGRSVSFHVASFIRVTDGKIASIDEYWGDDGRPPQWRQDMGIGTTISGGGNEDC